MPPSRLRLKIIKDAPVEPAVASDGPPSAQMRVLDMSMLPFTLYVRVDVPLTAGAQQPLFLHLLGRPVAQGKPNALFLGIRLPDPPATEASGPVRRILLVLIGEEIPEGRYRLALVQNRQHIAVADIARRVDQVRVLTRVPVPPIPDPSPLLISGTHKSGTTWLEKVIDSHPDFIVLHEANTFNILEQSTLRRMVAERQAHFRDRHYIRWLNPAYDVVDFSRLLQISLAKELTIRLGRAWGSRFVADRTPGYCALYAHLPRFWEELRIVHIVRHPLDVLTSRLFHEANLERNQPRTTELASPLLQGLNARLESGADLKPGAFVSDADASGPALAGLLRDWRRDQDSYLAASRITPAQLHLVKYEDLLSGFDAEAGRIFGFVGADPARTDLAIIRRGTSFEALSGGRRPGQADPRSFFRKGVAGDWRNVFSPAQAAALWKPVAETASAFGYSLDEPARARRRSAA